MAIPSHKNASQKQPNKENGPDDSGAAGGSGGGGGDSAAAAVVGLVFEEPIRRWWLRFGALRITNVCCGKKRTDHVLCWYCRK